MKKPVILLILIVNLLANEAKMNYYIAYDYIKTTKSIDILSKEYKEALLSSEKAVKLDSSNVEYLQTYAVLLLQMKSVPDAQIMALESLDMAIEISPNNDKLKLLRIQALFNQEDYHATITYIKKVLEKKPVYINHAWLINIYLASSILVGDIENSVSYMQTQINIHPENYGAHITALILYNTLEKEYSTNFIRQQQLIIKGQLKRVYKKYQHRLDDSIKKYIENLLKDELS